MPELPPNAHLSTPLHSTSPSTSPTNPSTHSSPQSNTNLPSATRYSLNFPTTSSTLRHSTIIPRFPSPTNPSFTAFLTHPTSPSQYPPTFSTTIPPFWMPA